MLILEDVTDTIKKYEIIMKKVAKVMEMSHVMFDAGMFRFTVRGKLLVKTIKREHITFVDNEHNI